MKRRATQDPEPRIVLTKEEARNGYTEESLLALLRRGFEDSEAGRVEFAREIVQRTGWRREQARKALDAIEQQFDSESRLEAARRELAEVERDHAAALQRLRQVEG